MNSFDILFEKITEAVREDHDEFPQDEPTTQELDEIEELRRFSAELQEPEPCSFTTT